jgi:hypothetical protein
MAARYDSPNTGTIDDWGKFHKQHGIIWCGFSSHYNPAAEAYQVGCRLLVLEPEQFMI